MEAQEPRENGQQPVASTRQGCNGQPHQAREGHSERSVDFAIFANPWVGFLGSVASLASLVLAFYFYYQSTPEREVTLYIDPNPTIIVNRSEISKISVRFDSMEISTDVVAFKVALWNHGKLATKMSDAIEPVMLKIGGHGTILDAKVVRSSRPEIDLRVSISEDSRSVIPTWRILEKDDGGVIQIVVSGNSDTEIFGRGVLEGQREVVFWDIPTVKSRVGKSKKSRTTQFFLAGINVLILVSVPIKMITSREVSGDVRGNRWSWIGHIASWISLFIMMIASIIATLVSAFNYPTLPPFPL